MVSGCLRAYSVASIIKSLCRDSSYLPLSSLIKAGLVDEQGTILSNSENPKAKKISLFYDQSRIQAGLVLLGVDKNKYNDVQQITLITCCQEAVNRVLSGHFGTFAKYFL